MNGEPRAEEFNLLRTREEAALNAVSQLNATARTYNSPSTKRLRKFALLFMGLPLPLIILVVVIAQVVPGSRTWWEPS